MKEKPLQKPVGNVHTAIFLINVKRSTETIVRKKWPMNTLNEVIIGIKEQMGLGDPILIDALQYLQEYRKLLSAESERKRRKCTKINCPIQMSYISNDCDIKTCPYRTERQIGKWKNVALFTRECSECGAQFHELEYDNFCPNCGAKLEWE